MLGYLVLLRHQVIEGVLTVFPDDVGREVVLPAALEAIALLALAGSVSLIPSNGSVLALNKVAGVALLPIHQPSATNAPDSSALVCVPLPDVLAKDPVELRFQRTKTRLLALAGHAV